MCLPAREWLLHMCQCLCLTEECRLSSKTLATPCRAGDRSSSLGHEAYAAPYSTPWQILGSPVTWPTRRSHSQARSFWGHLQQSLSLKASLFADCTNVTHYPCVFLGRGQISFRTSLEGASQALTSSRAQMTCE